MRLGGFLTGLLLIITSVAFIEAVVYDQVLTMLTPMLRVAAAIGLVIAVGWFEQRTQPHHDREPFDPPEG